MLPEWKKQGFKGVVGQWLLLRPLRDDDLGDSSEFDLVVRDEDYAAVSDPVVIRQERLAGRYAGHALPIIAQVIDREQYDFNCSASSCSVALKPLDGGFGSMDPWEWLGRYKVLRSRVPAVGEEGEDELTYVRLYPLSAENIKIEFDIHWPVGLPEAKVDHDRSPRPHGHESAG